MDPFNIFDRNNNRAIANADANFRRRNVMESNSLEAVSGYCTLPHNIIVSGIEDEPRSSVAIATAHTAAGYYPTVFISGNMVNCDRFHRMCGGRAMCKSTVVGGLEPFRGLSDGEILSVLMQLGKRYLDFAPSTDLYTGVYVEALKGLGKELTLQNLFELTLEEVFAYLNVIDDPRAGEKIGMIEDRQDYDALHALVSELIRVMRDKNNRMDYSITELVNGKTPLIVYVESRESREAALLLDTVSLCVETQAQKASGGLYVCFDSVPVRYNEVVKRCIENTGPSEYWLISNDSFPAMFRYDEAQTRTAFSGRRQVVLYRQDAASAAVWSRLLGTYTKTTSTLNPDGSVTSSNAQEAKVKEEQLTTLQGSEAYVVTPDTDTIFKVLH